MMRRHEEDYARREPFLYPVVKAFISASFNRPEDAIEYASMVNPDNFSMALAMIMIREKAHYDIGDYANAAACSGAALELTGSLEPHFPEEARARLASIFAMDGALSGQPPLSVNIGEPETINLHETGGMFFVKARCGGKEIPVVLNTEDYYNEISLKEAQSCGITLLSPEITWNGKTGYIGMANDLRIANVELRNVPFFINLGRSVGPTNREYL